MALLFSSIPAFGPCYLEAYVEGVQAASRALVINALLMTIATYAIPRVPCTGHTDSMN